MLLDVTPLSLGLETMGGVMTKVIERNTTIPARRTETFSTAEDNQTAVDVVVLQGERELASDNRQLARFRLEGIRPAPRGAAADRGDVRHRRQRHPQRLRRATRPPGAEQKVTISESTNLDQSEIERMVRDAEQHADEDRRAARGDRRPQRARLARLPRRAARQRPAGSPAGAREGTRRAARRRRAPGRSRSRPASTGVRPLIADLQQLVHALPASAAPPPARRRRRQRRARRRRRRPTRRRRGGRRCRVHA